MEIYIYKNNQQMGPFADSAIFNWIRSGQLSSEDFACRTGDAGWQPLKKIFPGLLQSTPIPAVSAPSANSQGQFYNQQVVEWARRNLIQPAEVKLRYNSMAAKIFVGLVYSILGVFLLGIPCALLIGTIYKAITQGWNDSVGGGLFFGLILLIFMGGLFLLIFYLPLITRRKIAVNLNAEGLETRGGKKFAWGNLHYLNYKKNSTRVRGNLLATAVQSAMFIGAKKVTVELIFANGKAVVPPLISNQQEILQLLDTIPAQRCGYEAIR